MHECSLFRAVKTPIARKFETDTTKEYNLFEAFTSLIISQFKEQSILF
jgi:hypothetical protein